MTNEEHIEQLKKLRSFHNGSYGRSINKAIEALKQEPILDKIRAEILSIGKYEEYRGLMPNNELEQVIQIIDKYRGES